MLAGILGGMVVLVKEQTGLISAVPFRSDGLRQVAVRTNDIRTLASWSMVIAMAVVETFRSCLS